MLQPIGKPEVLDPYSIKNLPPLIIGGAVFNYQYSSDPHSLPVQELIERAFQLGLNALDTSPYYGPSEEIIGQALQRYHFLETNTIFAPKLVESSWMNLITAELVFVCL